MNCTRVLHAFGSKPQQAVMPVDLAMCLSLSRRQPLYQLLSMSPLKPTEETGTLKHTQRPCQPTDGPLKTRARSSSPYPLSSSPQLSAPSQPRSCFRRYGARLNKKRVVFADAKGLALTAVRLFIPEIFSPDSTLVVKPPAAKLQGQPLTSSKQQRTKFTLNFPQPTLDLKAFLARLRENHVQLQSCSIAENSLSGKVCVSNVSSEKAVHIRVTYDSWRSHLDVPCTSLQELPCGGSDIDVFTFNISLPKNIDPKERVEFCVQFRPAPGATPYWDNNSGLNYRLCVEKEGSHATQSDFSRFYPRLSQRRPSTWPSHASCSLQGSAELQYQKSLFSQVGVEGRTLCSTK